MKKHTLFLIALLCTLVCKADDYTTYLTSARGFTEVTSTSGLLTGDYYYVLASAENTEMIVSVGHYEAKPGWAPEETIAMRYKSTDTDPVLDPKSFFILEKLNDFIGFRSLPYSICMFQTNDGEGHIWVNAFLYEHNMGEWDCLAPTFQNGYWVFKNQKFAADNFHLGPWNKVVADGEAIAGNRTDTAGDEAGHYRLFRISKADYETKIRAARVEALANASETAPLDATWMIKNPSFDQGFTGWNINRGNPDTDATLEDLYVVDGDGWHTNVGGNDVGWGDTYVADYGMSNKDGVYLYNSYAWWATSLNINQTLANVPNGQYELSAVLCSHANRTVTLRGNNVSTAVTTTGAGDGIPASVRVSVENGTLNIKAETSVDWWTDQSSIAYTEERTIGFFKVDNFQLKCLGLYADVLPLPNNTTTVLAANQWYYYDAPATAKYILTGNLKGMEYCTGKVYKSNDGAMPTKEEMGFPAGRVFFKTTRSDATLKVEPASPATTFTVASMNVDGLPLQLKFPIVGNKDINPDGPGSTGTQLISSYVANKPIDMVAFQEDFNYDTELRSNMGAYTFGTKRASITTDVVNNRPVDTDGLQFATRNAIASFANESITRFNTSHSQDVVEVSLFNQNVNIVDGNSLIKKGFRYYEVTVGGEKLDVFITHTDAGTNDGSSTDAYVVSREAQMKQIAQAILAKGNPDRPKILMGDTNCRWTREDLKANFFDVLSDTYDVGDAWVELNRSGVYPTVGQSAISDEVVDKFLYINPKGSNKMKLTPVNILYDSENYIKTDGTPLSDHTPVVATFSLALYEEVDNHVQTDIVGDDGWDMADLSALVNILVGKTDSSYNMDAADVNGDGSITLADLTELVNIMP